MGACHAALGKNEDALQCFTKAVCGAKGVFGECSQPHAGALSKQCTALASLRRFDEALRVGFHAAEIIGTVSGEDSSEYGESLYTIGRVYLSKKDLVQAKRFFLESCNLMDKSSPSFLSNSTCSAPFGRAAGS